MNILFCLSLFALAVFAVISIVKENKYTFIIRTASAAIAFAAALIAGLTDAYLMPLAIGIAIFTAVGYALPMIAEKIRSDGVRSFVLYMAKALAVVLVLEAVVFNFNSYHLWRGEYEKAELNMGAAALSGFDAQSGGYVSNDKSASVEFTGIDKRIGTITLDLTSTNYKTNYVMDFTDETNAFYRVRTGLVKGSVYNDIDATSVVVCDFSGKVGNLKIRFEDIGENTITLRSVRINEDYPSEFSYFRVLLILLGIAFVWLFKRGAAFSQAIGGKMVTAKAVTAVVVVIAVMISAYMTAGIMGSDDFKLTQGNQITGEIVDAFEAGQAELLKEPSQELLSMENPYDWSARLDNGLSYLWDHVLYDGKYYSYYGAGPVVLLFLPYHLITGYYFPSAFAVLIFNTIALIFIGMTFWLLMKKLFSDIPLSMYTAALVIVLASCGVWYCTAIANFYEIAQSSGFCFVALGAYFLVSSDVIGEGKIRSSRAALSSLFLAIAVTCRPTTAVWCVVAVAFIVAGVLKLKREEKPDKKRYAVYLLCALVPFAVIGGLQAWYNYIRFDSFTDFGIDYSLTINDFTHTEFHTQLAAIGFFDYLFAAPSFSGEFPYITTTLSTLGVNGYYFVATSNGAGLLFRALPTFFLFASPFALKYVPQGRRLRVGILFSLVAFVAPFAVIGSIWESGYGVRYMMDFAWEMVVCALMVMFLFYRAFKSEESKKIYRHLLLISMFAAVAVAVALTYSYFVGSASAVNAVGYERFARMFSIFNT